MKNQNGKSNGKVIALIVALAVLASFLAACLTAEKEGEIDEAMVAWVNEAETEDARAVADAIRSIDTARKESRRAEYEAESRSIAESMSVEESRSIEESLEEYLKESYAAVLESVRESIASGGEPAGVLEKDKIVSVDDEAIPTIRKLYSDVVVLGNSRAKSVLESGILDEDTVLYKWAAHMDEITDMVITAASLYRGKALFIMGVNDLGYYMSNVEQWRQDYISKIELFRSINPAAEIYLQEIIPIDPRYRNRWHNLDRVTRYNEVLYEIAEATGTTVVSATDFAFPEFLSGDTGAYYNKQFHFYWAQTLANQMGLWEEE